MIPELSDDALQGIRLVVDSLRRVSVSLDLEETLAAILDGLLALVPFDAAGVYVVEPEKHTLIGWSERGYPTANTDALEKARSIVNRALNDGESLTRDVAADRSYVRKRITTRSEMAVPIQGSKGRLIGAINIESDSQQAYSAGSLTLLELFTSAISGAIERAVLHTRIVAARRAERELELARQVMAQLLPRHDPRLGVFEAAAALRPLYEVGGDYYDYIPIDQERWGVAVADVSGKGLAAALYVAALKASLHALVRSEVSVRSVLRRANQLLHESAAAGAYVTLFYAELDLMSKQAIYINAGHPPPIIVRRAGQNARLESSGVPVGLFPSVQYSEGLVALEHGDVLALYTDGITEAESPHGEQYGIERLETILGRVKNRAAKEICQAILEDVDDFTKGARLEDDQTFMLLKVESEDVDCPTS